MSLASYEPGGGGCFRELNPGVFWRIKLDGNRFGVY